MKKVILVFTIMLLLGALVVFGFRFTVCATADSVDELESEYVPVHFSKVSTAIIDGCTYDVIVHVETGVLYVYGYGQFDSSLTVILNADGTPMTYDQFKK